MAMARREALPATQRIEAAQAIAARGLPVAVAPGMIVSGYSPLKSEISPMPLLRRCADAGAALARRDALPPAERMGAALAIAEHGLQVEVTPGTVVSGFSPRSDASAWK